MKNIIENIIIGIVVSLVLFLIFYPVYWALFVPYTKEKVDFMRVNCESSGGKLSLNVYGSQSICVKNFTVQDCIEKWVDAIDEKYNNPDTVSNLRETEYSEVVKQCQETFGNK